MVLYLNNVCNFLFFFVMTILHAQDDSLTPYADKVLMSLDKIPSKNHFVMQHKEYSR